MNEQNDDLKQMTEACGPGCSCGTSSGNSRIKWVVCGVVALAVVVIVAARITNMRDVNSQAKLDNYQVTIPSVTADRAEKSPLVSDSGAWTSPLKSLAALNQVAADTEAVFVVLPSNDADRTAAIQKEVSAAAATIIERGTKMRTFLLSQDSQEYASLAQKISTPAVLAMYKGRGMVAVPDKEITQASLLKAFVGSSRPSGCCPSGSSPSSSKCN